MEQIITSTGKRITLKDWQHINHLPKDKAATYFRASELDYNGELLIAAPLLNLIDKLRERIGKPVNINSGYRTAERQAQLRAAGYLAATTSPHTVGMAVDIDTTNRVETMAVVNLLRKIAAENGYKIRLGYNQYLKAGQTFVHVDVCPMYYAAGQSLHKEKHPLVWEKQIEW